jgi:hypothetical protein
MLFVSLIMANALLVAAGLLLIAAFGAPSKTR